ncbi:hypothetical protein AC579_229 [Pseudocercospora musae]|uniref:Uncharacterized protein n=1 Tax=Pseudocercospora musae TaxID=113226 RepID=A0A139I9F7_9PEZI|nr:hypothetical protein AC579_229 [Pseudocercospora musae]
MTTSAGDMKTPSKSPVVVSANVNSWLPLARAAMTRLLEIVVASPMRTPASKFRFVPAALTIPNMSVELIRKR